MDNNQICFDHLKDTSLQLFLLLCSMAKVYRAQCDQMIK